MDGPRRPDEEEKPTHGKVVKVAMWVIGILTLPIDGGIGLIGGLTTGERVEEKVNRRVERKRIVKAQRKQEQGKQERSTQQEDMLEH